MGRKMKNAPVYFTVGQVQHNPLLNLSTFLPAIQERMRKAGYPGFKHSSSMQFTLSPAMASTENDQMPQPGLQKVDRYLFSDIWGKNGFLLQSNSLMFRTTEYDTFPEFLDRLELGLAILNEVVGGLSYFDRLGLRYLDAVVPGPGESVNAYLANEVTGLPAKIADATFAYAFSETSMLSEGIGQVISRTIIQAGILGFPPDLALDDLTISDRFKEITGEHAMIDTDGFSEGRHQFDVAVIREKLDSIHGLIEKCFHATVSDHGREQWNA